MQRPRGSTLTLLELAYPVRGTDGATIGALRALIDANDLYTVLAPVRVGVTGHAVLVRSTDGLVLASDESERILKATLPGFDSLRSAMEGFPIARVRPGAVRPLAPAPRLLDAARGSAVRPATGAMSSSSRRDSWASRRSTSSACQWLVTVEQDLSEALAPVQTVTRYLWIHFIGVFATVILLALYFSFKLERPVMEEDLHLHEEHVPAGMRAVAS